jgi:small subunit ribosomal protein S10
MSQKIRIKLKSYDFNLVDKSADKIVKTVKNTGAVVTGPIPLPTHKKIFTVLRSPHVNKKSREQFKLSSYKRLLDIYSSSSKTIDALMKLEVLTPEENMGDIVGDLNRRRGQVNSMDDRAGAKVVKAEVPLSEMFGYVTSLRTLSSGRATSTMEFAHYSETPSSISETVISEVNGISD